MALGAIGSIVGRIAGVAYTVLQRTIIESSVARGLTARATVNVLREAGVGLRYQAVLALRREISGATEKADRIKYVRPDYRITENLIQQATRPFPMRYRFYVDIVGREKETGQERRIHAIVNANERLTRREIENRARIAADKALEEYNIPQYQIRIIKAYRSA